MFSTEFFLLWVEIKSIRFCTGMYIVPRGKQNNSIKQWMIKQRKRPLYLSQEQLILVIPRCLYSIYYTIVYAYTRITQYSGQYSITKNDKTLVYLQCSIVDTVLQYIILHILLEVQCCILFYIAVQTQSSKFTELGLKGSKQTLIWTNHKNRTEF